MDARRRGSDAGTGPARSRPVLMTAGVWAACAVAVACLVIVLNAAALHALTPNSDAASLLLEGQSAGAGHLFLHGWALSLDSFWTAEVPFYALAYLLIGTHPVLLSLVPAVLASLVIVFAVLIARQGRTGGAAVAGTLTVLGVLAFPTHALALFLLLGGAHLGVTLGALIAFYALRRGQWGVGVVVAVAVLTAGMLGDLQEVAYATVPVFVAGLVAMGRRRSVREGLPAVFTAVSASALALAIRRVADVIGTFTIGSPNAMATSKQMGHNLKHLVTFLSELLGLQSTVFGRDGMPSALQDVHTVGAVLVVVCLAIAGERLIAGIVTGTPRSNGPEMPVVTAQPGTAPVVAAQPEGAPVVAAQPETAQPGTAPAVTARTRWWQSEPSDWPLDDMLTVACFSSAASFVALASSNNPAFTRYLTASVVFLVVLAGRVTARAWSRATVPGLRRALSVVGALVLICVVVGFGYTLAPPRQHPQEAVLAAWLEQHHLTSGVGSYWIGNITTVQSGNRVAIRPVIDSPSGRLVRYDRESDAAWYNGHRFQFLVFAPAAPWGNVNPQSAVATFGLPAHGYIVDRYYAVLVWDHPFTVAPTGGFGS